MERTHHDPEEGFPELGRRSERGRVRGALLEHEAQQAMRALLDQDIVPRLMNAHRAPLTQPTSGSVAERRMHPPIEPVHVQGLVDLSLHGESPRAAEFVFKLRDQGVPVESLYLDLLTPAARQIGAMWEADTCDFVLVTLALLRLQQVMYDLSPDFLLGGAPPTSRRILVSPVPGSHHTLGAGMVAEFFRRDGWDVISSHDSTRADLLRQLRRDWFDVVALSISTPQQMISTNTLIAELRRSSNNKGILVMVGGPLALAVPDLATRVGADIVSLDAKQAVDLAGRAVPVRGASVAN